MNESYFSPERTVETVLYLAERVADADVHGILKLRYWADQAHLSRYGFIASGDSYKAMKFGPVASSTYDMLKIARGDMNRYIDTKFKELVSGAFTVSIKDDRVTPLRKANLDKLSIAECQCLDEAIATYGHMDFGTRTDVSHDDAWKKAWAQATASGAKCWEMPILDIAALQSNAAELIDFMNT